MTPPITVTTTRLPRGWWIYLLLAMLAAFWIGRETAPVKTTNAVAPTGDCVNRDTSLLASGLSKNDCKTKCPTCSWVPQ